MADAELSRALDRAIARFLRRLCEVHEAALRAQFARPKRSHSKPRRRSAPVAIHVVGPQPWPANTNGACLLDELGRYVEPASLQQFGAPLVVALVMASVLIASPPLRPNHSATIVPRM